MDALGNPDAVVTLTVDRYLSVTQGVMTTAGANPDVTTALRPGGNSRVSRQGNNAFEVSGGNPQGNNPLDLQFEVLPCDRYTAAGLVVKNLHNISEGGVTSWDDVRVGSGANDNTVTVRDKAPLPAGTPSITYAVYVLIRPRHPGADLPVGDYGLIDPFFTNR